MAFEDETRDYVDSYVRNHIADEDWHRTFFNFIDDAALANRLGEEFFSARYLYKLLEGLEAVDWMQRAQVRLQVLSYASIYEAALHHLLFANNETTDEVQKLLKFKKLNRISIPAEKKEKLSKALSHDCKEIIPTYEADAKHDITKVRFDRKAECACSLGIIDFDLREELIEFYEARNSIHIHAEIRKGTEYELDLSKRAYRRMEVFKSQVEKWKSDNFTAAS